MPFIADEPPRGLPQAPGPQDGAIACIGPANGHLIEVSGEYILTSIQSLAEAKSLLCSKYKPVASGATG